MSDWIPVPEIENVLIVLAELSDDPNNIAEAPVMSLLESLKNWHGASVYLFHNPPEAGEILEDADPEMTAQFALAAQMSDLNAEVCRDALRRVFSRATVQRVVLVNADQGDMSISQVEQVFTEMSSNDMVWAGEWPRRFILGMREFHAEIFSDLNAAENDLRKCVEAVAGEKSLKIHAISLV